MRGLLVVSFIVVFLSGCIPRAERSVAASDLVFGAFPGTETVLRVKRHCSVQLPNGGPRFDLTVGDYIPVYADSRGVFYAVPVPESKRPTRAPEYPPLEWMGMGVYFPNEARPSSPPFFWRQSMDMEWGRISGKKEMPLPPECWQPYGAAMAIVHNGQEVPLR